MKTDSEEFTNTEFPGMLIKPPVDSVNSVPSVAKLIQVELSD